MPGVRLNYTERKLLKWWQNSQSYPFPLFDVSQLMVILGFVVSRNLALILTTLSLLSVERMVVARPQLWH